MRLDIEFLAITMEWLIRILHLISYHSISVFRVKHVVNMDEEL